MATQLVTDSLLFNWDSDDFTSGGTSWKDRISSAEITVSNGATKGDDGLEFTSSNSFYSDNLGIGAAYPLTFEWIGRLDSFNTGHMWGLGQTSGSWSYAVNMYSKATNCIIDNGATQTGIISTGLLHIVITFTSSTAWTIYYTQGGSLTGTPSSTSGTSSYSAYNKNYLYNNEGNGRFVGAISKMRIWNKALSSTEITTLFTEEGGTVPTTVESSTSHGTYYGSIENITDGDTSTYWWSNDAQSAGTYVQFSFSKPVIFNGLTYQTLNNTGDCISSGTLLQVSEDGENWTTVGTFDGSAELTFSALSIKCQYVRIYASSSSNKWLCINEITLDYTEIVEALLLKIGGAWVKVTAVYQKVSGTWVEADASILNTDTKYVQG